MLGVVQSLWVGQLSPLERMCMRSFVKQGHPFHLYVYEHVDGVPEGVTVESAAEVVPMADIVKFQNLANFSDYFRYSLLHKMGGWWADLDVFCLRPFDFNGSDHVFSSQLVIERTNDEANAGVIKAKKGSEVMSWCLDRVADTDTKNCEWPAIGPRLVMEAVKQFGLQDSVQPHETFCPLHYFEAPQNIVGHGTNVTGFGPETLAVHLWNEELRRAGEDKFGRYPESLYERLQRDAA